MENFLSTWQVQVEPQRALAFEEDEEAFVEENQTSSTTFSTRTMQPTRQTNWFTRTFLQRMGKTRDRRHPSLRYMIQIHRKTTRDATQHEEEQEQEHEEQEHEQEDEEQEDERLFDTVRGTKRLSLVYRSHQEMYDLYQTLIQCTTTTTTTSTTTWRTSRLCCTCRGASQQQQQQRPSCPCVAPLQTFLRRFDFPQPWGFFNKWHRMSELEEEDMLQTHAQLFGSFLQGILIRVEQIFSHQANVYSTHTTSTLFHARNRGASTTMTMSPCKVLQAIQHFLGIDADLFLNEQSTLNRLLALPLKLDHWYADRVALQANLVHLVQDTFATTSNK